MHVGGPGDFGCRAVVQQVDAGEEDRSRVGLVAVDQGARKGARAVRMCPGRTYSSCQGPVRAREKDQRKWGTYESMVQAHSHRSHVIAFLASSGARNRASA